MKPTVSRTLLALGLALSVVGAEPRAEANQSAAAPNPAVEAHYNAGVAAAKKATSKQDWEKACEEFTQAYALEKNPQIAANLGNAELKAGRMRLAAEHLDYFLQQDKEASKEAKKEIEHLLEQAKKHIVTVKINVNQVGAKIVIDNVERGMSPLEGPIYLEENEHTFEVRKAGMKAEKQAHVFKKGDKREIRFEMVADVGGTLAPRKGADKGKEPAWRTGLTVAAGVVGFVGVGGGITLIGLGHDRAQSSFDELKLLKSSGPTIDPATGKPMPVCDYTRHATVVACSSSSKSKNRDFANILRSSGVASIISGAAAFSGMLALVITSKKTEVAPRIHPVVSSSHVGIVAEGIF